MKKGHTMQKNIFLEIKNIKKEFYKRGTTSHEGTRSNKKKTIHALKGVSLDIYEGEILGLLGVNGAGKTTLSSIIATLHPPTSGDILFKEKDQLHQKSIYKNVSPSMKESLNNFRKLIGLCPQKPNLIESLTVRQNIIFAGRCFDLPEKTILQRLHDFSKKYELEEYLDSKPESLSGGYKQRVSLVRSLIHNPQIIILDEPTVGLDPHIRHYLWENIRQLKKENKTIILTTHYLDEAEALSDRICILDKGKIKLIDTPENLKNSFQKSRLEDVLIQLMQEETL